MHLERGALPPPGLSQSAIRKKQLGSWCITSPIPLAVRHSQKTIGFVVHQLFRSQPFAKNSWVRGASSSLYPLRPALSQSAIRKNSWVRGAASSLYPIRNPPFAPPAIRAAICSHFYAFPSIPTIASTEHPPCWCPAAGCRPMVLATISKHFLLFQPYDLQSAVIPMPFLLSPR